MIKKIDNCIYCGGKLENHTAKKKYCSDKCRVYYSRELKRGTLGLPPVGQVTPLGTVLDKKQHNHSLNMTVHPTPTSEKNIDRIAQLEKELKNIPSNLSISKKLYISVREKELTKLKLKSNTN